MKGAHVFLFVLLIMSSPVHAMWTDDFYKEYSASGIDPAVKSALGKGKSPDLIIKTALPINEIKKDELIKALFCGMALPGSIYEASEINNIPDATVSKGYQLALAQCANEIEETLNSAVYSIIPPPALSPSKRVRGTGYEYASPWKFE